MVCPVNTSREALARKIFQTNYLMQLLLTLTEQSLFACTIKLRMVASKTYTVLLCGVDVARSIKYGMVGHLLVKGEKAS